MCFLNLPEIDSYTLNFVTMKCLITLFKTSKYMHTVIKNDSIYSTLVTTSGIINCIHKQNNLKLIRILYNDPLFQKQTKFLYTAVKKGNSLICKCIFNLYKNSYKDKKSILSYPIKKNDNDLFYFYINNNADIHAKKNKALATAARFGNFEIVKTLVEKGAYVNGNNNNILKFAIESCDIDIVKYLHTHGAQIHSDYFAIITASQTGDVDIFKYILKYSNNVDKHANKLFINACSSLSTDLVKYIYSRFSIQVSILNRGFIKACYKNDLDTVSYLHSLGADLNCLNSSALDISINNRYNNLSKWLCTNGANIEYNEYWLVTNAIKSKNIEILLFIFAYYTTLVEQPQLMENFLISCIKAKNLLIFTKIYELCNVKLIYLISFNLIIFAIENNTFEIMEIILNSGFSLEKPVYCNFDDKVDPLTIACSIGNMKIIKLLLFHYKNNIPGTALIKACLLNNLPLVNLLLKNGADSNYETNLPLHAAAENSNLEIIKLLLDYNGHIGINSSILQAACNNFDKDVVKLIIKNIKCNTCKKRKRS